MLTDKNRTYTGLGQPFALPSPFCSPLVPSPRRSDHLFSGGLRLSYQAPVLHFAQTVLQMRHALLFLPCHIFDPPAEWHPAQIFHAQQKMNQQDVVDTKLHPSRSCKDKSSARKYQQVTCHSTETTLLDACPRTNWTVTDDRNRSMILLTIWNESPASAFSSKVRSTPSTPAHNV